MTTRQEPSEPHAGPSEREAGPTEQQAGPSGQEAGRSKRQAKRSELQTGPSERQAEPSERHAGPSELQAGRSERAPRIVSLLASGTEIVEALGLGDHLVGISHECDHPPHLMSRPRVSRPRFDPDGLSSGEIDAAVREAMASGGSVYEVDAEALEALRPNLIITQAVCEVCAVPTAGVQQLVRERGIRADIVSLDAHTIEDILASMAQVAAAVSGGTEGAGSRRRAGQHAGGRRGGGCLRAAREGADGLRADGPEEALAARLAALLRRLDAVQAAARGSVRALGAVAALRRRLDAVRAAVRTSGGGREPRVLGIEWLDPPFAPGHWVPEMIELAGGRNVVGEAGQPSRQMTWQELEGSDPDVLLIMPCGYDLEASRADADAHAERLLRVAPRAVAEGRAWVVDGSSYFNRSGPRVVTGVEILGELLHPTHLPAPDPRHAARWSPP